MHPAHPDPLGRFFLPPHPLRNRLGTDCLSVERLSYIFVLSAYSAYSLFRVRAVSAEVPVKPSADHAAVPRPSTTNRSRITNGSAILEGIDGRSAPARRFRDVLAAIVADLGGAERLSEGQRQLARRCSMLSVECEKIESEGVQGKPIDLDAYGALTDRLGRAFQRLGLKRVPRDITPTLGQILSEVRRG
jgi:hypothetical protein